jgi:flagellar biosynthesis/type III secretory pathway M-ring protein FliF/YscJ
VSRTARVVWIVVAVLLGLIVLFFVAQRLISPDDDTENDDVSYMEFVDRVQTPGEVEAVTIDQDSSELEVAGRGDEYEVAYLEDDGEAVVALLNRNRIPYEVESWGGGTAASWFFYLLPAVLFGAFWFWLARRLDRLDRGPSQ